MKKSRFQMTIEGSAVVMGVAAAALFALEHFFRSGVLLSLAITAFTFFYHFVMRLIVGAIVPAVMEKCRPDPRGGWFSQKPFENKLYKKLKVKSWKDKMPTYSPDTFSLEKHSLGEIIASTCTSELVHEVIVLFSFVPIVFIVWWGAPAVFIITSVLAACFDLSFVIMQRYNRPRLLRLSQRKKTE